MKRQRKPKNQIEQSRRFIETARELGTDNDGDAFERGFGKIVPPKQPKPQRKKPDVARDSDPPKSG